MLGTQHVAAWLSGHVQAMHGAGMKPPFVLRAAVRGNGRGDMCAGSCKGYLKRGGVCVCVRRQIVVLGKSLGGAVSLHLAADNPSRFKAIVVENTFISIEEVAPKVLPLGCHSHDDRALHHRLLALWRPEGKKLAEATWCITCSNARFPLLPKLLPAVTVLKVCSCGNARMSDSAAFFWHRCCHSCGHFWGEASWATSSSGISGATTRQSSA